MTTTIAAARREHLMTSELVDLIEDAMDDRTYAGWLRTLREADYFDGEPDIQLRRIPTTDTDDRFADIESAALAELADMVADADPDGSPIWFDASDLKAHPDLLAGYVIEREVRDAEGELAYVIFNAPARPTLYVAND